MTGTDAENARPTPPVTPPIFQGNDAEDAKVTTDNVPSRPLNEESAMGNATGGQELAPGQRVMILNNPEGNKRAEEISRKEQDKKDDSNNEQIGGENSRAPNSLVAHDPRALLDRISELDERVVKMEHIVKRRSNFPSSAVSSEYGSEDEEEPGDGDSPRLQGRKTIAAVRECNWEQFKNRFGPDDKDYVIECLLGGSKLDDDIADERKKRTQAEQRIASKSKDKSDPMLPTGETTMQSNDEQKATEKRYLDRIRISSPAIIKRLGDLNGETWPGRPRTFFRPFRAFIHFHGKMKKELQDLEDRVARAESVSAPPNAPRDDQSSNEKRSESLKSNETSTKTSDPENSQAALTPPVSREEEAGPNKPDSGPTGAIPADLLKDPHEQKLDQVMNSRYALEDLRCYVNFVEEKLMPLYNRFDNVTDIDSQKIQFDDLWYLFRSGELIYVPSFTKEDTTSNTSKQLSVHPRSKQMSMDKSKLPLVDQRIWRLLSMHPPVYNHEDTPPKDGPGSEQDKDTEPLSTWLNCYYLDYNGESYGPVIKKFDIYEFEGEKPIQELEIYPLRFVTGFETIKNEHKDLGTNFVRYLSERPLAYNGWTLTRDPEGESIQSSDGKPIRNPEHIESDVIVDFKEALQTFPRWMPRISPRKVEKPKVVTNTDRFFLIRWSDIQRTDIESKVSEVVVDDDDVDWIERNQIIESDPYIKEGGNETISSDEDLLILPRRMFAYALRERKFVHVDAKFLKPITEHQDAFNSLKINVAHRRTIESIVDYHFKNKEVEKTGREIRTQDLIRGKGRGLIILLHGVPGVGKTATAEAVAQANKKPLFSITSGDLGYTPESVEVRLGEIFRLAHLWDCVLLLDEADVFLSQRTNHDLQRNALVSVFLRILEYFNGILFLTTNRPGTLDEAVKSRVHVALYYDHLGETETEEIFRINLARLKEIEKQRAEASGKDNLFIFEAEILEFARQHFRKHINGSGKWNGRQIRNAFQIAASLAHYDVHENTGAQRQLGARHFQMVDDTTMQYDQYRTSIFGKTDHELAQEREERSDGFGRERGGERKASFYGSGPGYAPSNQFQTPSPMATYTQMTQPQGGPPPQMMTGIPSSFPQTPPAQRTAPPPASSPYYGAQQHEQSGYATTAGYASPPGGHQLPPMQQQQQAYASPPPGQPQHITHEPASYVPGPPSDPRFATLNQGYGEYAGRGPSPLGGPGGIQSQAGAPGQLYAGRGPYDPTRDVFASGS